MQYFDELKDENGHVRMQYRVFFTDWEKISNLKREKLFQRSKSLFAGDYYQDIFPRVLTNSEYLFLKNGIKQRARAILAFLEDFSKNSTLWKQIIPSRTFLNLLERYNLDFERLREIKFDSISFPYGHDIIRDAKGRWRVIEDSVGTLGGIGDIPQGRDILCKLWPNWNQKFISGEINVTDVWSFYSNLINHFKKMANKKGGIPVLVLSAFKSETDNETLRLANIFKKFGIEITTDKSRIKPILINPKGLKGVFLKGKFGLRKIGAIICHYPLESFCARSLQIDLLKYFDNQQYKENILSQLVNARQKGLITDFVRSGDIWCNFTPGFKFLNDKQFGMNIDQMVVKLLKERPIIKGIPAKSIGFILESGKVRFNELLWKKIISNPKKYVLKKVNEDGGSHVWIGNRLNSRTLGILENQIRNAPEQYIAQSFEHLSVLNGNIVDLRIHAHIDTQQIIINETAWGRANYINSDGKVNLSGNGFCSPILVLEN